MSRSRAADDAAAVTRSQWQHYLTQFGPLEESLTADLNSEALVTQARETAARQSVAGEASLGRTIDRYGMGNAPGAMQAQLERQRVLGDAESTAQAVNTARLDQRDRNTSLGASLMQVGRGVANQGLSGMGDVSTMEANRNAHNSNLKAQQKAQQNQTAGALATAAIYAASILW